MIEDLVRAMVKDGWTSERTGNWWKFTKRPVHFDHIVNIIRINQENGMMDLTWSQDGVYRGTASLYPEGFVDAITRCRLFSEETLP